MKTWLKYLSPTEKLLAFFLVISHLLVYFFILKDAPYFGDENHYSESSSTLLNIFSNSGNPHAQSILLKKLVGDGYFMPFYAACLTPLKYLKLTPENTRLFFMIANIMLSLVLVTQYKKSFGKLFSTFFLLVLVLLPTMLLYNSSIAPEGLVAKLILIAILFFYRFYQSNIDPFGLVIFTLTMVSIVLFRQSTLLLFLAFVVWYFIQKGITKHLLSTIKKLTLLLVPSTFVIATAVLFWSNHVTNKYGPGYLTTTSTDLSFMVLWGEGFEELGDPRYPSVWRRLNKHYLQTSRAQGITFKEAVMIDKNKVWKDLTIRKYLQGIKRNIIAFVAPNNSKIKYVFEKSGLLEKSVWIVGLRMLNAIICFIILLSILVFLMFPKFIQLDHRKLLSFLIFIVPFLMIHTFVARANGRHGMVIWWLLSVIGCIVISNLVNYFKSRKTSNFAVDPMNRSYIFIINFCRIYVGFLFVVLLFF